MAKNTRSLIAKRFRGYLPVVVDVETAGLNPDGDALLEIAIVILDLNSQGIWESSQTHFCHLIPFEGANLDKAALEFLGVDPYHPFRFAVPEKEGLKMMFKAIHQAIKLHGCSRAILVGHNPSFDLNFINAAIQRTGLTSPFHRFSTFDTATLGGLIFGQTVLAKVVRAAGFKWDSTEAHSAIYDAERTADFFCAVLNLWEKKR
ncbi:MAG: ribonuclease T [Thiomargarita sp.]|nr:ribonuclease T [Thiomargarita sp.]